MNKSQNTSLKKSDLLPIFGTGADLARETMAKRGHKLIEFYQHDLFKIIKSVDASGKNGGNELHISVSHKSGLNVSPDIAMNYARLFCAADKWEDSSDGAERATHLYLPLH